jgi:hypothetical protein
MCVDSINLDLMSGKLFPDKPTMQRKPSDLENLRGGFLPALGQDNQKQAKTQFVA